MSGELLLLGVEQAAAGFTFARPFDVGGLGTATYWRPFNVESPPLSVIFNRPFNVVGLIGKTFARPFDLGESGMLYLYRRPFDVIDATDGAPLDPIVYVPPPVPPQMVNAVQALVVAATSGTYTLTFDGQTTAPIAWDADAAAVQAALESLPNIAPGDVIVTET